MQNWWRNIFMSIFSRRLWIFKAVKFQILDSRVKHSELWMCVNVISSRFSTFSLLHYVKNDCSEGKKTWSILKLRLKSLHSAIEWANLCLYVCWWFMAACEWFTTWIWLLYEWIFAMLRGRQMIISWFVCFRSLFFIKFNNKHCVFCMCMRSCWLLRLYENGNQMMQSYMNACAHFTIEKLKLFAREKKIHCRGSKHSTLHKRRDFCYWYKSCNV